MTLTVNGTFEDTGAGTIAINGDVQVGTRGLTIAQGGTYIPGGDGIGTTTILPDNTTTITNAGRVLFSTGSTNIFKIDPAAPANTLMLSVYMGWGPNQSAAFRQWRHHCHQQYQRRGRSCPDRFSRWFATRLWGPRYTPLIWA